MTEPADLSERELDVLRLVATGASNKQIAQDLSISQNTVKVHIRNIFSKTGVASRTEAAIFAVQHGVVDPASVPMPETGEPAADPGGRFDWGGLALWQKIGIIGGGVLLVILVLAGIAFVIQGAIGIGANPNQAEQTAVVEERWQEKTPLEKPRSGLALAAYDSQIYAIAGETPQGIVGEAARYNPSTNEWNTLAAKPTPVRDVKGVAIGGRIYVPGGLLENGDVSSALEIFDPSENEWGSGAELPAPVSAYAAVAFEGQLYLFGGWDGKEVVDSVFRYDPDTNEWDLMTPMPTARGFAGAAESGGQIYVIGGRDSDSPLAVNEEYTPSLDIAGGEPWGQAAPLPAPRAGFGLASIAGIIHLVGGEGADSENGPLSYKFFPQNGSWEAFETFGPAGWSGLGLVAVESSVHAVGGGEAGAPTDSHFAYIAIYTISIPIVQ